MLANTGCGSPDWASTVAAVAAGRNPVLAVSKATNICSYLSLFASEMVQSTSECKHLFLVVHTSGVVRFVAKGLRGALAGVGSFKDFKRASGTTDGILCPLRVFAISIIAKQNSGKSNEPSLLISDSSLKRLVSS